MKTRRVPCSGSANLEDAEKGTRRKRGRESFVEEEEEKKKKREEEEKGTFYFSSRLSNEFGKGKKRGHSTNGT